MHRMNMQTALPGDVLFHLLQFLPGNELDTVRRVSSDWNQVASEEGLWKFLLYRSFSNRSFQIKWYHNKCRRAYIDLYQRRIKRKTDVAPIVINENDMNVYLYNVAEDKNGDIEVVERIPLSTDGAANNRQRIFYTQATFSPYGDMLAVSRYARIRDVNDMIFYDPSICIKQIKGSACGRDLIRISTSFLSFYNYWSPDGQHLSWLSSYSGRNHPFFGIWIVNVGEMLYSYYINHRVPGIEYSNMWDYYNQHSDVTINVESSPPADGGAPYFYTWKPLSSISRKILTSPDPSLLKSTLLMDSYTPDQGKMLTHPEQHDLRLLDLSRFHERITDCVNLKDFFVKKEDVIVTQPYNKKLLDTKVQGGFDNPIWLPNGQFIYVERRTQVSLEPKAEQEVNVIVFEKDGVRD